MKSVPSTKPQRTASPRLGHWTRLPNPPANLVKNLRGHEPSSDLLAWAEREGVDLINIKIKSSDGKWFNAFKPLGMKVWRIENTRFDGIETELRKSQQLKLPAPWEGPLAQIDEKSGQYDAKLTASFLITKEGTCGAIQIDGRRVHAKRRAHGSVTILTRIVICIISSSTRRRRNDNRCQGVSKHDRVFGSLMYRISAASRNESSTATDWTHTLAQEH